MNGLSSSSFFENQALNGIQATNTINMNGDHFLYQSSSSSSQQQSSLLFPSSFNPLPLAFHPSNHVPINFPSIMIHPSTTTTTTTTTSSGNINNSSHHHVYHLWRPHDDVHDHEDKEKRVEHPPSSSFSSSIKSSIDVRIERKRKRRIMSEDENEDDIYSSPEEDDQDMNRDEGQVIEEKEDKHQFMSCLSLVSTQEVFKRSSFKKIIVVNEKSMKKKRKVSSNNKKKMNKEVVVKHHQKCKKITCLSPKITTKSSQQQSSSKVTENKDTILIPSLIPVNDSKKRFFSQTLNLLHVNNCFESKQKTLEDLWLISLKSRSLCYNNLSQEQLINWNKHEELLEKKKREKKRQKTEKMMKESLKGIQIEILDKFNDLQQIIQEPNSSLSHQQNEICQEINGIKNQIKSFFSSLFLSSLSK